MTDHKDIESKSFEEALTELEGIVQKLESGEAALEESISLYERGAALKVHCETRLKAAREKVEKIILDENGAPATQSAQFD